jgi:hypothetical protein
MSDRRQVLQELVAERTAECEAGVQTPGAAAPTVLAS